MASLTDGDGDATMLSHDEDGPQHESRIGDDLDEKYPNRPFNHSTTFPFHDLIVSLFDPLIENRRKPRGPVVNRKKTGPDVKNNSPHEQRRNILQRFVSRWKKEVGLDIYPAFRLIMPDKDRDRAMYGLKEKTIGKLLVKIMKIDKNSADGDKILNWKLPGSYRSGGSAGDFAQRCYEVLKERPIRTTYGDLTVGDVNRMLDEMSAAQKEENQLPIFNEFYQKMSAEELLWLIRIILRQMKIGATEKTILDVWHPDAENLFNVSSSLRRVCWELHQTEVRLNKDDSGISLMQCFQPQLAAFQMHSMEKMVTKMRPTEDDPEFWIEEKLDGERMQMHMIGDPSIPGGRRFGFWSRKAKDYTYLYGNSFHDTNGALTRFIKDAFSPTVRNVILDGEMITWDPRLDVIVSFGHLKTAALEQQSNPYGDGNRPLFRVFDCLYLNDTVLTNYTLYDRYKALQGAVTNVDRRLEVHTHHVATKAEDIEPLLREVVAQSTEGLVLKNPRSIYRLNERNDDWFKVKPEYMSEFGEALDCIVIGGYYGTGRRGGFLSSFMCGLRVDDSRADPMKCYSFFKVGGGFTAGDYAEIQHLTRDKWRKWDPKKPPTHLIELGGGDRQFERPDMWIRPDDSVVLEVKAAQSWTTDQFRMGYTLRFPRLRKIRKDKDWKSALSVSEFITVKKRAEEDKREKEFRVDDEKRKKRGAKKIKRETVVVGQTTTVAPYAGPSTKVFEGMSFLIMSDQIKPKKSKADIETYVKANGGTIVQNDKDTQTICIAEKNLVKVSSMIKTGKRTIIKPRWLFDCVKQTEVDVGLETLLLPFEPDMVYFCPEREKNSIGRNVDGYGDSYARDMDVDELKRLLDGMPKPEQIDDAMIDDLKRELSI